ncbi:S1C family serine protease [Clostridium thailandense]|uniref:S1C family serine protease n=1 Tax=Clostridium thailandense TaxID=2794346 RepID=UPI0039899DC1
MNNFDNETKKSIDMENNNNLIEVNDVKFYNCDENAKSPKPSKHKGRKVLSYVMVGLLCSVIGGTASTAASLYLLPKSSFFKDTPLYQSIVQSSSAKTVSALPMSSVKGSLSVADIAKKVGPAVVGVSVKSTSQGDFFSSSQEEEGMGSGIIINEDGYILTNNHVISGADTVSVILNNKQEVPAKVVNYDSSLDLAIIKVTKSVKMPAVAELGSSKDMQVGDPVVAIGNPLGKELLGSVTTGVVSAMNREISVGNSKQTFIQTDAAINPGNSGGALVNSLGQVIGINSAKIGGNGVEGIGFAIPIDTVKTKINSLLKPILKVGISAEEVTSDMASRYNVPQGVHIVQVQKFSAAENAGIQTGDIITKFDGKSIKTVDDINKIKSEHKSGDKVQVDVYRNGENKSLTLKLTE